ncbi:hypothetical protein C3B79_3203 [Aeromonas hydrophila]|nr:hypothetical protein C3B79_3203 [Aeromonas hydrophila]
MVHRGEPLFPQILPLAEIGDEPGDGQAPRMIPAIVTMMMGSWYGIASSVNFPNIS